MLRNRERRNGLIVTQQRSTYGKYNKASNRARYTLSDIVLDSTAHDHRAEDFDISNDSFKMSDVEDEEDYAGAVAHNPVDVADDDTLDDIYQRGGTGIISIAVSDHESDDENLYCVWPAAKQQQEVTHQTVSKPAGSSVRPLSSSSLASHETMPRPLSKTLSKTSSKTPSNGTGDRKRKSILQELNNVPNSSVTAQEKRQSVMLSNKPSLPRTSSSNLSKKNRSSVHSNQSKRWSMLSFNDDSGNSVKTKRFSISSLQSDTISKRFSISSANSSSSSFKNVVSKVGNALSSVSVSSGDASNESTPFKNVQPGVVNEPSTVIPNPTIAEASSNKRPLSSSNAPAVSSPVVPRKYSMAVSSVTNATIKSSYQAERSQVYSQTFNGNPNSRNDLSRVSTEGDQLSVLSTNTMSSLKSSKSRFRLSSLFTSSKKDTGDSESIRTVRGRSSFGDMRKSVLSMSSSKQSLFRLVKKESLQDLKRRQSVDKMMISLPKPDTDSANKLKNKLKNSSSIISINSVISGAPSSIVPCTTLASYDDQQLKSLLNLTSTDRILDFKSYISQYVNMENQILVKYAEASYSEVFVLKNYLTQENLKIFKVIPFGDERFEQPCLENVIQELKVNLQLNSLDGFIKLNSCHVVEGCYPKLMLKLWDDYNELKGSNNFRPEFESTQRYLLMDLEYGGVDLEHFKLLKWKQALEIFWSVAYSLTRAEKLYQFEHRDLHWGNIVIEYKQSQHGSHRLEDAFQDLSFIEENDDDEGPTLSQDEFSVKIIDYTLSRLQRSDGSVIHTRLDHQDFFKGRGDYQFDIYRMMRSELKSLQKSEDSEVDWSLSSFRTNLMWLHYLLDKLVRSKGITDLSGDESREKLERLLRVLNPRRKKLSQDDDSATQDKYFNDFHCCEDVLNYGKEQGLV